MTDELKVGQAVGADTHTATSQLLDFLNANAENILTGSGSTGSNAPTVESIVFPTDKTPGITNSMSGNFEDMVLIKATDKTIKASEQVKASDEATPKSNK